ncbi:MULTISPECIES: hypothetical protein [unclassified Mesorhizobium]|uniref:hypothetical protein n=1 Tax=unclassified Mesorhizobium TaxID=325217 RepID=UPI000FE5FD1C|nr:MULTISPECIES: hypothetical protein [unclassified Mesorhizobium]RWC25220.1 MAG: hypothetical protein EOS51_00955 [Mesorhizobium sp.]RWD77520.1 MAG: hypothetical protein EOS48_29130 [Mesorhizobium sp.]RWE52543.1 MAG: hypothetical protein EOS67_30125 [Mesorhizobium sp.]RWE97006.1 MAG: hypothetical protein EOS68_16230 [Mesorhizobium sp.]RWF55857.1 MAG: hypothetical protein EOS50_12460 [Mesorhizobium sp.]
MNEHFATATAAIPALFAELHVSSPFPAKGVAAHLGRAGVYVFFEDGVPVHVGRTRNLQGRLRGHTAKTHYSASFAFKRARRLLERTATYTAEGSRLALSREDVFRAEFYRQIELVKLMNVRFVDVADPVAQYLLELYAHLEYGLLLDEFDTH